MGTTLRTNAMQETRKGRLNLAQELEDAVRANKKKKLDMWENAQGEHAILGLVMHDYDTSKLNLGKWSHDDEPIVAHGCFLFRFGVGFCTSRKGWAGERLSWLNVSPTAYHTVGPDVSPSGGSGVVLPYTSPHQWQRAQRDAPHCTRPSCFSW